jgi:hypothetical protein
MKVALIAVVGVVIVPAVLLGVLWFCNPFLIAFVATLEVANRSGRDAWVTPIAKADKTGEYRPVPRVLGRFPAGVRLAGPGRGYDIHLRPGESVTVRYHCDDVSFRGILVRSREGEVHIVGWPPEGPQSSRYAPPDGTVFSIPPLGELPRAPLEMIPCTKGEPMGSPGRAPGHVPADP